MAGPLHLTLDGLAILKIQSRTSFFVANSRTVNVSSHTLTLSHEISIVRALSLHRRSNATNNIVNTFRVVSRTKLQTEHFYRNLIKSQGEIEFRHPASHPASRSLNNFKIENIFFFIISLSTHTNTQKRFS